MAILTRSRIGSVITAIVPRRATSEEAPTWTPATRNVRPYVDVYQQLPPEKPRYGDIPSRPARQPIYTAFHWHKWQRDSFAFETYAYSPHISYPAGIGMALPVSVRPNIERPSAVAYGSLFTLQNETYGLE